MASPVQSFAVPGMRLGKTERTIPVIGQGTYKYTGGVEPLRAGIKLGATLIDTAEIYGTERVVGEAIKGHDVFISTKPWTDIRYADVIDTVAEYQCYRALDRDMIDLYMVHFPMVHLSILATMMRMERLKDNRVIRHIGVCNHSLDQLKEAQDSLRDARIEAVQYRYNLDQREIEDDILPYCQANDVTVMAYEPLGQGRLGSKAREALQFCVKQGTIPIVRSGNVDHIKANIEAACEAVT